MNSDFQDALEILIFHGVHVESECDSAFLTINGIVNPADVRVKVATILSVAGFQGYYLKETYGFMASKNPWRTDELGHVEFVPWEDFKHVPPPKSSETKKPKLKFKDKP